MPKTQKTPKATKAPKAAKAPVAVVSEQEEPKMVAAIRIRGCVGVQYKIEDTMKMLRLHHVNHATVLPWVPTVKGMLSRAKDYITYGPITPELLEKLLTRRGRGPGNRRLTEEYLKEHTEFRDLKDLATAIYDGRVKLKDLKTIKPVFRLHPPKGGHRMGIKWPYAAGGTLGKVPAEFMEKLLMKMM